MEDKEAEEKIADYISLAINLGLHLRARDAKRIYLEMASAIFWILKELGYRKLPKDKPPLLSDGEIRMVYQGMITDEHRVIAQAQRDSDINWYSQH